MSATEKIMQIVNNAKQSAEKAEREFEYESEVLQVKAGRTIDLFGRNAVSRVADIASESKKICDTLYATYQMLVKMLDGECRPLLDQGPDYLAVREVRDLIKKLNDDSEIQNNFTASLNGHGLGGVASARYIPSIENKMVQSYWETKCDTWPGRAEAERAERQRMAEKESQTKKAAANKMDAEEEKYKKAYAEWKAKVNTIEKRRTEALNRFISEAKTQRMEQIKQTYAARKQEATEEKDRCERDKAAAEASLAAAGFFQFTQKQNAQKTIKNMTAQIAVAEDHLKTAEQTFHAEKAALEGWLNEQRENHRKNIDSTFPLPTEPKRPYFLGPDGNRLPEAEIEALRVGQIIVAEMYPGELYSIPDLQHKVPELSNLAHSRISAILRRLCTSGQVKRVEESRKVYYRLID